MAPRAKAHIYGRFLGPDAKPLGREFLIQQMSYQSKRGYLYHLGYQGFSLRGVAKSNRFALLATHVATTDDFDNENVVFPLLDSSGALLNGPTVVSETSVGSRSVSTSLELNPLSGIDSQPGRVFRRMRLFAARSTRRF